MFFDDSDWTAVFWYLHIERRKWGRFSQLFVQKGSDTRTSWRFYVAVVQSVMIFRSESWVITPRILRVLGGLNNWVAQRIYVQIPR